MRGFQVKKRGFVSPGSTLQTSFIIICSEAHQVIPSFIQQTFMKHRLPAGHCSKCMDGPVVSQESRSRAFSKLHASPSHPCKLPSGRDGEQGSGALEGAAQESK